LPTTIETETLFALRHIRLLHLALLFKIDGGWGPHAHVAGGRGRHWRGDQDKAALLLFGVAEVGELALEGLDAGELEER
jgi:hypothetical protein